MLVPVIHITRLSWTRIKAEMWVTTFCSMQGSPHVVKGLNGLVEDTVTGKKAQTSSESKKVSSISGSRTDLRGTEAVKCTKCTHRWIE